MASAPAIMPNCPGMGCPISGSRQGGGRRMPAPVPEVLAAWMRPFRGYFTNAVWRHALVLVAGALLAPGRRTVTAALRVMGLEQAPGFAVHHRVLSHARWSSRADGPRDSGHRRHDRTALGAQDQGARHLPRSRAVQPWPLRQSQWPALALRHAVGSRSLGRLRLGPAVPDRAGALRAACYRAREAAQEAHRLGPAGAAADRALAPRAAADRRGRQQLRGHWTAPRSPPAPLRDLAAAPRCRAVCATTATPAGHAWPPPDQGRSTAEPGGAAGRPGHTLAPDQGRPLVWSERAPARHRLRHRALAPPRHAGADPLGARA